MRTGEKWEWRDERSFFIIWEMVLISCGTESGTVWTGEGLDKTDFKGGGEQPAETLEECGFLGKLNAELAEACALGNKDGTSGEGGELPFVVIPRESIIYNSLRISLEDAEFQECGGTGNDDGLETRRELHTDAEWDEDRIEDDIAITGDGTVIVFVIATQGGGIRAGEGNIGGSVEVDPFALGNDDGGTAGSFFKYFDCHCY